MTILRKLTAIVLAILLLIPLSLPAGAAQEDPDALVRQLINYFHYYQEDAALDYELILEQIRAQDPALADTWANILTFWADLNARMAIHSDVLPDDLPEDDSLCIVVMGYYLESNGAMRRELVKRMEVTLASALKYPNAYILCTGGGTASEKSGVTEAGQMAKWLIRNGIDSSRVIVESKAMSTIQNAIYGCELLYRNYPQIRSLAVVTSDYHIYRSCLYFHTQAALAAYDAGVAPMRVVANATCRVKPDAKTELDTQAEGIGMLSKQDNVEKMSRPWLTHLDRLQVSGTAEYAMGDELNLQVTAIYSNGYSRDVTARCNYTGFDFGQSGYQTVSVSYEEGLAQKTATFDVYVVPPVTEAVPVVDATPSPATEAPQPETPQPEAPQETGPHLGPVLVFAVVCLVLLIILLLIKAKQNRKRQRRKRPSVKLQ